MKSQDFQSLAGRFSWRAPVRPLRVWVLGSLLAAALGGCEQNCSCISAQPPAEEMGDGSAGSGTGPGSGTGSGTGTGAGAGSDAALPRAPVEGPGAPYAAPLLSPSAMREIQRQRAERARVFGRPDPAPDLAIPSAEK